MGADPFNLYSVDENVRSESQAQEVTLKGPLHFGLNPANLFGPHESRPWNPLPDGRSRDPARPVRRHPAPYRPAQIDATSGMSDGTPFLRVAADRIGAPGPPAKKPCRATNAANWSSIIRIGAKMAVIRSRVARRAVWSNVQRAGRVPYGESRLKHSPGFPGRFSRCLR